MTRVIGLLGYAGVGKDTMGAMLSLYGYKRFAFADALKSLLLSANPIVYVNDRTGDVFRLSELVDKIGWDTAKRAFPEVRELLQRTGMAARAHFNSRVWIDPVVTSIKRHELAVVTDIRLDNELGELRAAGFGEFTAVRLIRKGVKAANAHVSESGTGPADFEFDLTDYPLEEMPQAAVDLIDRVESHQRRIAKHKSRQRQALDDIIRNPVVKVGERNLDAETLAHLSGKPIDQLIEESR